MFVRSHKLTVLTAASYLLAITASGLFHNHEGCGHERPLPGVSASHGGDHHDCSVCQFLAQKPAPAADVRRVGASLPVQEVTAAAPVLRRKRRVLGLAQPRTAGRRVSCSPSVGLSPAVRARLA